MTTTRAYPIRNTFIALACLGAIGGGIAYFVQKQQQPKTVAVINTPTPATTPVVVETPTPAEKFKGYYAPQVLVSPMKDDIQYTPAGRGEIKAKAVASSVTPVQREIQSQCRRATSSSTKKVST